MKECLVDVLNARDTVLHVFPIPVEDAAGTPEDMAIHEALKAAADLQLVPEAEKEGLHARMHVSRGGQLTPFGDALVLKHQADERDEQHVRTHAYFLWQEAGCPDNQAEEYWHRACEVQHSPAG